MVTHENQKVVTTTKDAGVDGKKRPFATINIDALASAMALLKTSTFKVWIYLAKNANNYTFALSCVDVCRFCKVSAKSFHVAIQELIEVGYLVHTEGTHYNFYETLPEPENVTVTINKTDNHSAE
jgi:hypothetical protein